MYNTNEEICDFHTAMYTLYQNRQLLWQVVSKMDKVNKCFGSKCNERVESTQHCEVFLVSSWQLTYM
jgi:hypothetical protein